MHTTEQVVVVDQHVQQQAPPVPGELFVLTNHYALLEHIDILPLKLNVVGEDTPPELRVRSRCSQPHRMSIAHLGVGAGGLSGRSSRP